MFIDEFEDAVEWRRIIESDAHLDREKTGDDGAKRGEDFSDALRVAQETAADVFLVNLRRGATEIEIDPRDIVAEEFLGGPSEVPEILADQLGEHGAASGVLVDGAEDVFLWTRLRMDAEELGEKIVWSAVVGDDAHEREVRHVLHRGQRGERLTDGQRGGEGRAHLSSADDSPSSACCFKTRSRISVISSTESKTERAT